MHQTRKAAIRCIAEFDDVIETKVAAVA